MPAIAGCIIFRPKWNGAPGQKLLVIRRNHENRPSLSRPAAQGGPRTKTTRAGASRSMTVANLPMFRDAFRRRCKPSELPIALSLGVRVESSANDRAAGLEASPEVSS